MEKTCANHPESLALATCKACEKAICLMCVHDEREGTFCSEGCIRNFREVSDWVGTGGEGAPPPSPSPAPAAPSSSGSVFEEMPEHPPATVEAPPEPAPEPAPESEPQPEPEPAPASEPEPAPVAAGKTIGNPCYQHADIRAKAFCTRCRRPICGLCIVENPTGMFCSEECAKNRRVRRGSPAVVKAGAVVVLLAAAAGVVYALKPSLFEPLLGTAPPEGSPVVDSPRPPVNPKPPVKPPTPKPDPVVPTPEPPKPTPTEVLNTPPDAPTETGPIEVVKVSRPVIPAKREEPKPTRILTAWGQESPGDWYRLRTLEGNKAVIVDFGLKSRDVEAAVLITQRHAGGRSEPVAEKRLEHQTVVLHGEETLQLEDRSYLCEIRASQDGTVRQWVLMQGRHAGAILRSEGPEGRFVADRLWENPVRVGYRVYDCLVVEGTLGEGRRMKTWYSPTFPLGAVRLELDGQIVSQAIDAGQSWADRPAAPK